MIIDIANLLIKALTTGRENVAKSTFSRFFFVANFASQTFLKNA